MRISEIVTTNPAIPQQQSVRQLKSQLDAARGANRLARLTQQRVQLKQVQ
jgi:hypothetical protein